MDIYERTKKEDILALPLGEELYDYLINGYKYQFGSFLTHILENDFVTAIGYADMNNQHLLAQYATVLHNYFPRAAFGSNEKIKEWKGISNLK